MKKVCKYKLMTKEEIRDILLKQFEKVNLIPIEDRLEVFDDCGGTIDSYQYFFDGLYAYPVEYCN